VVSLTLGRFTPREINSSQIEWKAVWAPQQVWTFWKRDKSLATADIGMPDCPASCTVTALTTVCCFPNIKIYCVILSSWDRASLNEFRRNQFSWVSWDCSPNSLTIAVILQSQLTYDSGKKQKNLDKYPILCIQF
jgi:hypothetical protein